MEGFVEHENLVGSVQHAAALLAVHGHGECTRRPELLEKAQKERDRTPTTGRHAVRICPFLIRSLLTVQTTVQLQITHPAAYLRLY